MPAKSLDPKNRQDLFELLAEELMQDKPDEKVVRDLSKKLGLPYTGNMLGHLHTALENAERFYGSSAVRSEKLNPSEVKGKYVEN